MAITSQNKHALSRNPLHQHPLHPSRLGKIILGDQQVTLLGDTWRVAKPRANDAQRELALEVR
jgi:hypothetical protein